MSVPVASRILAMLSVDGQRGRPSAATRLDLLKVVGSSPARRASPEALRPLALGKPIDRRPDAGMGQHVEPLRAAGPPTMIWDRNKYLPVLTPACRPVQTRRALFAAPAAGTRPPVSDRNR